MRPEKRVLTTFLDTLFVVALPNPGDKYHSAAHSLAHRYMGAPLVTTDAVLLEVGNTLARQRKTAAVELIDRFLRADNVEIVPLTPALFDRGFELYRKYQDKLWGLVDCISFVVMWERGMTEALTFDQHYTQAGFNALMRGDT
jgi:predicted nucleic acid-binding protein